MSAAIPGVISLCDVENVRMEQKARAWGVEAIDRVDEAGEDNWTLRRRSGTPLVPVKSPKKKPFEAILRWGSSWTAL